MLVLLSLLGRAEPAPLARAAEAERNHRFGEAQDILQQHLAQHPRDGLAWIHLASVASVTGEIVSAQRACDQAVPWIDPIGTLACRGRIALFTQQYDAALKPLTALLQHPQYRRRQDHLTRWAAGVAAELAAAMGLVSSADGLFARALQVQPSEQIRAAWCDHLLASGRPEEVLAATDPWQSPMPLQVRRLIALKRLGKLSEAQSQVRYLDWEYRSAMAREEFLHGREMARFYLDVLPRSALAQTAATRNLDVQHEAEDYALYQRALQK